MYNKLAKVTEMSAKVYRFHANIKAADFSDTPKYCHSFEKNCDYISSSTYRLEKGVARGGGISVADMSAIYH